MECSVEGCVNVAIKRGFCNAHYLRQWRHGDPQHGGIARGAASKFILDHVHYDGDECLIWPFARTDKGYPMVNFPGMRGLGHRIMCILAHGSPPTDAHETAHSCGNGHQGCINPNHVSWKTHQANIDDKVGHGTQQWGEQIHFAKLTEDAARRVKYGSESVRELVSELGVSRNTIIRIRANQTWKGL